MAPKPFNLLKVMAEGLYEKDYFVIMSDGECRNRGTSAGMIVRQVCPNCIEMELQDRNGSLNFRLGPEGEEILRHLLKHRHKERKARHAETTQHR